MAIQHFSFLLIFCLLVLVAGLPSKGNQQFIYNSLNGDFPSWVRNKDRTLLRSSIKDIKANIVVAQDGSGNFKTIVEAMATAPNNSNTRYIIYVKKGTYKEKVEIYKQNVMLMGDGMDATLITGSLNFVDGANIYESATVVAIGPGFIAQDIWFQNIAGPQKQQAVALRVDSDQSVINRCQIEAYQDTLFTNQGKQFYRDSIIIGTIDFIFGDASVVFQKCQIVARKPISGQSNMITAQGREDPNKSSGISIQQCNLTASEDLKPFVGSIKTYLGRPWKKYSRTIVMQSYLDNHIDPEGWAEWSDQNKDYLQTLYYGEYNNTGPGSDTSKRVKWPGYHIITSEAEASNFTVSQLIGSDWLKNTGVNYTEGL